MSRDLRVLREGLGLAAAAVGGRITNREGAIALHLTIRQFQRLKRRFRDGGAPAFAPRWPRAALAPPSPGGLAAQIQALLFNRYAGFNDTTSRRSSASSTASPCPGTPSAGYGAPPGCPPSTRGGRSSCVFAPARRRPASSSSSTAVPSTGWRRAAALDPPQRDRRRSAETPRVTPMRSPTANSIELAFGRR